MSMKNSRYVVSPRKSFNRRPVSSFGRKSLSRRPVSSFGRKLSSRRPVNSFGGQLELHQILDLYDDEDNKDEKIRFISKNFMKNVSNANSRVKQRNFNSNLPQQLPTFKESDESNLPQQLPTIKESDESNDSIEELLALYGQNEKNISSLGDITKETNNIAYGEKFVLLQDYENDRKFLAEKIRKKALNLDKNEQENITQRMITLKNSGGNDGRRRKSRRSKRRSKKHSDGKRRKSRRSRRKHSKKY